MPLTEPLQARGMKLDEHIFAVPVFFACFRITSACCCILCKVLHVAFRLYHRRSPVLSMAFLPMPKEVIKPSAAFHLHCNTVYILPEISEFVQNVWLFFCQYCRYTFMPCLFWLAGQILLCHPMPLGLRWFLVGENCSQRKNFHQA